MAIAALRGAAPIDLPASGRSSVETLTGSMGAYLAGLGSVSPIVNFEMLACLQNLAIYNPDFSQYVANIVNLGNPGHSLAVDAANDAKAEAAVARLNESAMRLYPRSCGVDGLLDQYLTDIAIFGAVSSEDVVNITARRVERVVIVPAEQIRFIYDKDTDSYRPYQRSSQPTATGGPIGLRPLNEETYKYFALSVIKNSPYAKPPATAAVEAILDSQKPIMDNIRWIAKKYGILGLVAVGVAPIKQKGGETDTEYAARFEAHLRKYADSLSGNFNKGLIVLPKPNTIDTTSVAPNGQGLAEVNTISEQQVFSGLGTQPGFHGRTDSTTETFADVVYYLLKAQVAKMQRVAKRRQESTYMLDLRLGGIDVDGVTLTFDRSHSRNALDEANTEKIQLETVLEKIRAGAISPTDGANELGLDDWYDEEALAGFGQEPIHVIRDAPAAASQSARRIRLQFDKGGQRYRYVPERLRLSDGGRSASDEFDESSNVIPLKKKVGV